MEEVNVRELTDDEFTNAYDSINGLVEIIQKKVFQKRGPPKKKTQLEKYVQQVKSSVQTKSNMRKIYDGLSDFFFSHEAKLKDTASLLELPRGTVINYGSSGLVTLEIQNYVNLGRDDEVYLQNIIKQFSLIKRYITEIPAFPGIESGSELDIFIRECFSDIKQLMSKMQPLTQDKIKSLMGSDVVKKLITKIKTLSSEGKINPTDIGKKIALAIKDKNPQMAKMFEGMMKLASKEQGAIGEEEAKDILSELGEDPDV